MTPPSTILVTGGTGFIGSQFVADLLPAGHRLRLVIRKESQIAELKARFAQHASQLDFVVIPDITNSTTLASAIGNDVEYIFHLASPMPGKGNDFKTEYLAPAVNGTKAILNAASGVPSVRRVIIMSSLLALMPLGGMQTPGLEIKAGSNPSLAVSADMPFPEGPAGYGAKYSASKILAHRATLEWMASHKPAFSLVTIHPTFVLGRDATQTDASAPGGINRFVVASLATPPPGKPMVPANFVDVRDVSSVLARSLGLEVREGELLKEVLVAGRKTGWDEVVAFVKRRYPEVEVKLQGPFAEPFTCDTSVAEKELGVEWTGIEETLASFFDQQIELRSRAGKAGLRKSRGLGNRDWET